MSIVINRFCQVIVNQGGKAHHTGWYMPNAHTTQKSKYFLQRGTAGYNQKRKTFWLKTYGEEIVVEQPLTLELFIKLTGWTGA